MSQTLRPTTARLLLPCVLLACGGLPLAGCRSSEDCERSRLQMAKHWEELKNSAGTIKYARSDEADQMSDADREERLKHWQTLEEKAALLESAFISRQITWESAETARQELTEGFQSRPAKGLKMEGFGGLLQQANQVFESFRSSCR